MDLIGQPYEFQEMDGDNMSHEIKLMPIWIFFANQGYTDEEIENLTLKEIEQFLDEC